MASDPQLLQEAACRCPLHQPLGEICNTSPCSVALSTRRRDHDEAWPSAKGRPLSKPALNVLAEPPMRPRAPWTDYGHYEFLNPKPYTLNPRHYEFLNPKPYTLNPRHDEFLDPKPYTLNPSHYESPESSCLLSRDEAPWPYFCRKGMPRALRAAGSLGLLQDSFGSL